MIERIFIMIHHSLTADGQTASWPAIERFHMEDPEHKWLDVGYHAGVELVADPAKLGRYSYQALVGRPLHRAAAACPQGGMNEKALHVCCVGNYDLGPPPADLLACLRRRILLPWMTDFGIPAARIVAHHDYNPAKTCPGTQFDMAALRRSVT